MSYHIKDLIADLTTLEKTELLLEMIDLLDAVNFGSHTERLEDILMTVDMYPPDETLSMIEATLLTSLVECCKNYGLYIYDKDPDLFKSSIVLQIARAFFILVGDASSKPSKINTEDDNVKKIVEYIKELTTLDDFELLELIEDVDDDLISAIEEEDEVLDTESISKVASLNRLRKSDILEKTLIVKELISSQGYGYDFYEMLSLFKKDITGITDLDQRAYEFIAVLLGSDLDNVDLYKYSDETIDYMAVDDEEAILLRKKADRIFKELNLL